MASYALALPIQPGQLAAWKAFQAELRGPRLGGYAAYMSRCGILTERTFHQPTPEGDIAVVLMECADYGAVVRAVVGSSDPFSLWMLDQLEALYGLTPAVIPQVRPGTLAGSWPSTPPIRTAAPTGRLPQR